MCSSVYVQLLFFSFLSKGNSLGSSISSPNLGKDPDGTPTLFEGEEDDPTMSLPDLDDRLPLVPPPPTQPIPGTCRHTP